MSSSKRKLPQTKPENFEKYNTSPNFTPMLIALLLFFAVFMSHTAFSQGDSTLYPMVTLIDGDTVTIFSLEQSKELTKRNEKLKDCQRTNEITEQQLTERDTTIANLKSVIVNQEIVEQNYQIIIQEKNDLKDICEMEKGTLTKEVKRQKLRKWFAIVGGTISTGLMTALWISK